MRRMVQPIPDPWRGARTMGGLTSQAPSRPGREVDAWEAPWLWEVVGDDPAHFLARQRMPQSRGGTLRHEEAHNVRWSHLTSRRKMPIAGVPSGNSHIGKNGPCER